MTIAKTLTALAIGAAALAPQVQAQSNHPVIGRWTIEYEQGRRMENGVVTPIIGKSTLVVEADGAALKGTVMVGPGPDGAARPPQVMTGEVKPEGAVFTRLTKARINANGDERELDVTVVWTLVAAGDELTGTMSRDIPGIPDASGTSPVKGTRIKS